jgi:hypothetical protein
MTRGYSEKLEVRPDARSEPRSRGARGGAAMMRGRSDELELAR